MDIAFRHEGGALTTQRSMTELPGEKWFGLQRINAQADHAKYVQGAGSFETIKDTGLPLNIREQGQRQLRPVYDHPGRLSPQARNFLTAVDYEYLYD